jgi:predicted component of type VI protein secretion system
MSQEPTIPYYKLPLQLSNLFHGQELPTCDMRQSIDSNLNLLIMTRYKEHRGNQDFGCEIWDRDFELIPNKGLWEEKLRQSLLKSVIQYETRLSNIEIIVTISQVEKNQLFRETSEVKNKVEIRLNGVIKKTGEKHNFHTNLYLSPLSME